MAYTVAELKDLTSVPKIADWSDDKILLYQSAVGAILDSLNMDTSMTGYTEAYNGALIMLFDTMAENPTGLRSLSQGKVRREFSVGDLPGHIGMLLTPFIHGESGPITGAKFVRKDIGLR